MDKIDRLFDAVEHPDLYSDTELEAMLQDSETCEVYDIMSKAKDAYAPTPSANVDAEWNNFSQKHFSAKPYFFIFFSRHAAAVIIGFVATLAAVAAGIGISVSINREQPKNTVDTESGMITTDIAREQEGEAEIEVIEIAPEIIVFKEENLDKILEDISSYYEANVIFKNDEVKTLRLHLKWDQNKPLKEVIEMLNNFEQIRLTLSNNTITVE